MSMTITKANPTPASQKLAYYVEFDYNNHSYSCEFYRDGTRQIFVQRPYPNRARKFRGTPQMNNYLTLLNESQAEV